MYILKRMQGQCKPNAESSLFAEAKPVLAGDFSEIGCKGSHFCAYGKINCTKSAKLCTLWLICAIFYALNDSIHIY